MIETKKGQIELSWMELSNKMTVDEFLNYYQNKSNEYIEYIPLFDESDGTFPNHHPDPAVEENLKQLKEKVLEEKADCGIAFDGDGDRVGVVDNQGNMIPIDKFMIIIWRDIYNKVAKKEGFFDVKCSKALKDELIVLHLIVHL